jgi:hypothetical protein
VYDGLFEAVEVFVVILAIARAYLNLLLEFLVVFLQQSI